MVVEGRMSEKSFMKRACRKLEETCTFLFADDFGTFCVLPFFGGFLVVMNSGFVRQAASNCISELAARVAGPLTNRRVRSLKH